MNSNEEFTTIENPCPKCVNNKNIEKINKVFYKNSDIVCDEKDTVCKDCSFYYSKYTIIQIKKKY